jgi:hypothetical protein
MTITALPPAPNRANDTPQQFSDKADAFAAALIVFGQEANADVAGIVNTASVPLWSATTNYVRGNSVYSPITYFTYRLVVASLNGNVGNLDPSNDTTNWRQVTGTGNLSNFGPATLTNISYSGNVDSTSTTYLRLPVGTSGQRPASPVVGQVRYNTTISTFEGFSNGVWGSLGGGATGGGADQVFVQNDKVVTTSYSIPSTKHASSVGPVTINDGVTVTIPDGSNWVIQ